MIDSYAKETRETWRVYLIFKFFSILLHSSDLKERFQLYGSFYLFHCMHYWYYGSPFS